MELPRSLVSKLKSKKHGEVNEVLNTLRTWFVMSRGACKISKPDFTIILRYMKGRDKKRVSLTTSLLGYACLKQNYRALFLESEPAIASLFYLLRTSVDEEILCRALRLAGNLLRSPDVPPAFLNKFKGCLESGLMEESLKCMNPDTRTCFAMAFK